MRRQFRESGGEVFSNHIANLLADLGANVVLLFIQLKQLTVGILYLGNGAQQVLLMIFQLFAGFSVTFCLCHFDSIPKLAQLLGNGQVMIR